MIPFFVNCCGVYTTWFSRKLSLPNFLIGVIFCVLLPTSSTGWGYYVLCKLSEDQQYLDDWMSCCCGGTNKENMQSYGQELNFFDTSTSPWKWAFMQGFTMLLQNKYQRQTIYIHITLRKAKGMNVVWEEHVEVNAQLLMFFLVLFLLQGLKAYVGVLLLQTIFTGFTNGRQKLALNLEDTGDMYFTIKGLILPYSPIIADGALRHPWSELNSNDILPTHNEAKTILEGKFPSLNLEDKRFLLRVGVLL